MEWGVFRYTGGDAENSNLTVGAIAMALAEDVEENGGHETVTACLLQRRGEGVEPSREGGKRHSNMSFCDDVCGSRKKKQPG